MSKRPDTTDPARRDRGLKSPTRRVIFDGTPGAVTLTGKPALAGPVNLENETIDMLKAFVPDAVFSDPVADTDKGTAS